jgi:DinB superfamily
MSRYTIPGQEIPKMTGSDLINLYEFSYFALKRNLDGVTNEESLLIPQPAGNCINWVLGHIVSARGTILALAGGTPLQIGDDATGRVPAEMGDIAARYRRGSGPIHEGDDVLDLGTLRGLLADSQQQLIPALAAISEETLALPVPEAMRRPPLTGSVGDALARLACHEGYHNGQIGLLRRLAGKPGAIA